MGLNDKGGHSCSFRTNLVSFRTFRCPLFLKPVFWLRLPFLPFLTANRLQLIKYMFLIHFYFTICRNHSDEKAYHFKGVNRHFSHRRRGPLNDQKNHHRGSMLLCPGANFVMLPFQESQFESSPVLWNRQRRSREGEKMLLLNKICLTFVILVHT